MADLDLDIKLVGRAAKPLGAETVRELTSSDLALLATERGVKPTALTRISDRHHALARCLAVGMNTTQICLITGYTPSRISILKGDPAFEELIQFYRENSAEDTLDYQKKATLARNMATDLLIERMDEEPDKIDAATLHKISKDNAAITGHGPKSNVNVNVSFGDRLGRARERTQRLLPSAAGSGTPEGNSGLPGSSPLDVEFTEVPRRDMQSKGS